MQWLENRIPPPLVAALFAVLMLLAAQPRWEMNWNAAIALALVLLGATVCLAGVVSFRLARTTVNPLRPETASSLVAVGVYRYTRNPMYLGFSIILLAWSVLLAEPVMLLGVVGFVLYINRLQIVPEERALAQLFGDEFARYKTQVRRWL